MGNFVPSWSFDLATVFPTPKNELFIIYLKSFAGVFGVFHFVSFIFRFILGCRCVFGIHLFISECTNMFSVEFSKNDRIRVIELGQFV